MSSKPTHDAVTTKVDGRHARAERTREAIVDALLALVDEGNLQPTAQEVADRAGVALRSIRQHFLSRHDLLLAGAAKHAQRIARMHDGVVSEGPLSLRLDRFVAARADYLEITTGVRRAAALVADQSNVVIEGIRMLQKQRRREVERAFSHELDAMAVELRDDSLEALHVLASGSAWDMMRRDQGLTRHQATAVMRAGLHALVRGLAKHA